MEPRIRIGVDVGGTFTDFVLVDERRDLIFTGKCLTTAGDPRDAIVRGIERLLDEAGTPGSRVHSVVHGTTLVANTVIERTGARVGLVTTLGFRDVLDMARETRYDLYDLFLMRPEPLVPRSLRREVGERVGPTGEVLRPFDSDEFRDAVRTLVDDGVEAIAVSFLHAYRNPTHERAAKRILADEFPSLPASVSSDVAAEVREFERTSTTCANAYVQPLIGRYVGRLEHALREAGLGGRLYVMLSGGGITTPRAAGEFPVRLIESGPAGGAMAAAFYGLLTSTAHTLSFDMGGTTAKMSVIDGGWPARVHELEAARVRRFRKGSGLPLRVPSVDMIEIGAGGGSLAWVDSMGLLKVGPQSAGSAPGPACYASGGVLPTVTDADLLLGYLSPGYFLGGEMPLDRTEAERAIEAHVARPLGLGIQEAATGIHSVVNENMAAAARMHLAEKGRDARRYTLVAFGGAGPVHAYGLAKLLKLGRVICPFGAGVTSALGFLIAAPATDLVTSYVSRLEHVDWDHVRRLFAEMEAEARGLLLEAGADAAEITLRRASDMRYVGQGFEVTVPLPGGPLGPDRQPEIREAFLATYQALFGRSITDVPIESLSWRVSATAPVPNVRLEFAGQPTGGQDPLKGSRPVYFPETGVTPCPIYSRYALTRGAELRGPAVVEERESTTVVGPGGRLRVDDHLNLVIDVD